MDMLVAAWHCSVLQLLVVPARLDISSEIKQIQLNISFWKKWCNDTSTFWDAIYIIDLLTF